MRRGLVRFIVLLIDSSEAMLELDLKPDRIRCTSIAIQSFTKQFFDQNPISHMAIIMLRNGISTLVLPFSSSVDEINAVIASELEVDRCTGVASFQLGLERAQECLMSVPSFCTRELFCIWGSMRTIDSGDVFKALKQTRSVDARISVISYAPEINVLKTAANSTGGSFQVATGEAHVAECLRSLIIPPVWAVGKKNRLVPMGFPSSRPSTAPAICVCHVRPMTGGFQCPCCSSTVCHVPTRCKTCGLFLAKALDLAQCYRHIFPVPDFALQDESVTDKSDPEVKCQGCLKERVLLSDTLQCPRCNWLFCEACDTFIHECLYSCPGCAASAAVTIEST